MSTNFHDITLYYEKNKEKPFLEWLEFDNTFGKPGKQGLVGTLKLKKYNDSDNNKQNSTNTDSNTKIVFKISQYLNYLTNHELLVMEGLNQLSNFCPHFCRSYGIIKSLVEPSVRKTGNPFEIKSKYPIEKDVLLLEYIKGHKLFNYIKAVDKVTENEIYSMIKQVLLAIAFAQNIKKFTHYDLHSYNILPKKCDKDLVFLYVIDESNQFCVPTYGNIPIIIDYGFSYISDMEDRPLWASLAHTDVGFMSSNFDWVADPKLFLSSISKEINDLRQSKKSRKLRRIVKNMFCCLNIDFDSGWDDIDDIGAADYITQLVEHHNTDSELFKKYDHYCIDILQSLVILPLQKQGYSNIDNSYSMFIKEWVKIESEISNPFYNLYILKSVVDSARNLRADYADSATRNSAVKCFKKDIYHAISQVSKFCSPKDINFEKLLCSLLVFAKNMEGILYDIVTLRMEEKHKEYENLQVNSVEQIFGAIEANIPHEYKFNKNTTVVILDSINKKYDLYKIPESELKIINKLDTIIQGSVIYKMYKQNV